MQRPAKILSLIFCLLATPAAHATVWVGRPSSSGLVEQPALYVERVSGLFRQTCDFEAFPGGVSLNLFSLGQFSMSSSPQLATLATATGTVAGAQTASGRVAALVGQVATGPTSLTLHMTEPIMSVAFALMGLESAAWLEVSGDNNELLGEYYIPAPGAAGIRRWVGISEEMRVIRSVRVRPLQSEEYAIDDIELGVHAPEPASMLFFAAAGWLLVTRRPRPA